MKTIHDRLGLYGCSINMAGPAFHEMWATAEDWKTHRQIITKLYRNDDMTLKKVMEIMEREHNFRAT